MGLFVEDSIPGLHLLYKTAVVVVLAVVRWGLSSFSFNININFNFNFKDMMSSASFFFFTTCSSNSSSISHSQHNSSASASASASAQMIRDSLVLTSFEDVKERLPWVSDTCAVCLCQLNPADHVRQLRNCCHVFHQDCIDRWVDYHQHQHHDDDHDYEDHDDDHDNHNTCPLCRAPLLASYQNHNQNQNQSSQYGYGYGYGYACNSPNPKSQPSWAVERLLYLFGDDLLP